VRTSAGLHSLLEHLDGLTVGSVDPAELHRRLTDWQGLLERQPLQGRQILRKLLAGRLVFWPFDKAKGVGYEIRGQATYGRLLSGVISVVPRGGTPVVAIGNSALRLLVDFTRACRPKADRCPAEEAGRSHHGRFSPWRHLRSPPPLPMSGSA
jgi:hypothetical protein